MECLNASAMKQGDVRTRPSEEGEEEGITRKSGRELFRRTFLGDEGDTRFCVHSDNARKRENIRRRRRGGAPDGNKMCVCVCACGLHWSGISDHGFSGGGSGGGGSGFCGSGIGCSWW